MAASIPCSNRKYSVLETEISAYAYKCDRKFFIDQSYHCSNTFDDLIMSMSHAVAMKCAQCVIASVTKNFNINIYSDIIHIMFGSHYIFIDGFCFAGNFEAHI